MIRVCWRAANTGLIAEGIVNVVFGITPDFLECGADFGACACQSTALRSGAQELYKLLELGYLPGAERVPAVILKIMHNRAQSLIRRPTFHPRCGNPPGAIHKSNSSKLPLFSSPEPSSRALRLKRGGCI